MSPKSSTKKKPVKKAAKPAAKKASKAAKPAKKAEPAMPVNGTIVHVEFTTPDLEAATKFYSQVFGWQFFPFQPTEMYFTTPSPTGACGCILQGTPASAGTMIYVMGDIEATLEKGARLGATTVLPRTEIPGGHGFFAHMRAPDGNVFGIYSRH